MELHQLRYLLAVLDEGSFTAAAARERVSQSGVSAQVAKLERELGVRLLERGGRTVVATPAGEAVVPHARRALAAVTAVGEVADDHRGLVRGRVRLGMVSGCAIPPFLDAVARFRTTYPGVDLSLVEGGSDHLVDGLLRGGLDLALVGHAVDLPADLAGVGVVDEGLVAVVGAAHRWAGRRRLRLADLRDEVLLLLPVGTGVRSAFDRSCAAADLAPGRLLEASSPEALMGLAARGAGVAVLSVSMLPPPAPGAPAAVHAVPLVDACVTARLSLAWRPEPSAAAARLLAGLRSALGAPTRATGRRPSRG